MSREKFEQDLKRGEIGEKKVIELLSKSPKTKQVLSVSEDKYFQRNDVDLLQFLNNGQVNKVEVKTDSYKHTGNIAYEMYSSGNVGCLQRSIADLVFYYFPDIEKMYWFKLYEMREWVDSNMAEHELRPMGDNAQGYVISIKTLLDAGILKEY